MPWRIVLRVRVIAPMPVWTERARRSIGGWTSAEIRSISVWIAKAITQTVALTGPDGVLTRD
jgi:hypothetical protein